MQNQSLCEFIGTQPEKQKIRRLADEITRLKAEIEAVKDRLAQEREDQRIWQTMVTAMGAAMDVLNH